MLDRISDITIRLVDVFKAELSESGRISPYKKRIVPESDRQDFFLVLNTLVAREVIKYRSMDNGERYVISQFNTDKFNLFCTQFKSDDSPSAVFSDISKLKQKFLYILSAPVITKSNFTNGIQFFGDSEELTPATVDPSRSEYIPDNLIPARLDYFGGFIVTMNNRRYQLRGKTGATDDIIENIFGCIKRYPNRKYSRITLAKATNIKSVATQSLRTIFRNNILCHELSAFAEIGSKYICIHPEAYLTKEQSEAIINKATLV